MTTKVLKKKRLRHNEYYDTQEMFDKLYSLSKKGYEFRNLLKIISSEQNILLAYRNIKRNKGSKTHGVNKTTIFDLEENESNKIVEYVQRRLVNFIPHKVKRVYIPKANGKKRPLGIPTLEDRLIQQCILQVLEPICEAKFHPHSYGFRPNRSTHHAIARMAFLMNRSHYHYVVDIDIKSFFDNVNHAKLLKQMWTLGIKDKNLLSVISKMLKAEIKGEGLSTKGTPQGGILSPLLSNIVLNELDWWISSQWETHPLHNKDTSANTKHYSLLKNTNLKKCFIVRYADDFKIICKDYETAQKMFLATKQWLNERLQLEISLEKSKVVNLNKNYSEFLGFKLKLRKKSKKYVVKSHMSDKAKENATNSIRRIIHEIKENPLKNVNKYNSLILGLHNYYRIATNVFLDFDEIAWRLYRTLYNQLRDISSFSGKKSETFLKYYSHVNRKVYYIKDRPLFPISGVKWSPAVAYTQNVCNYTSDGRLLIHKNLEMVDYRTIRYLLTNPVGNRSIEYNDNRLSLYVAQKGLCAISKLPLTSSNINCHHILPRNLGGTDRYQNLVLVTNTIHTLIHSTDGAIIKTITKQLKLDTSSIKKLNSLRQSVGNQLIVN